jgi:non-haem Fe2+, alpha-ketoglutarate-dependent halogenase
MTMFSKNILDLFNRDGFLFPIDVLDAEQAAGLSERYFREEGAIAGNGKENPHLRETWLADVVRCPGILDVVEELIGPDIFSFTSRFFTKPPATGSFVSWHQDATYCGLAEPKMITVWLALTPSNLSSGCLQFVPGSHAMQLAHNDTFDEANLLTRGQEVAVKVDPGASRAAELSPGQISVHHPLIIHGSGRNQSQQSRVGFGMQFIPASAKPLPDFVGTVALVRGSDRFGHFKDVLDFRDAASPCRDYPEVIAAIDNSGATSRDG